MISPLSRLARWSKKPVPTAQAIALLLLPSVAATAAWLPPQTRHALAAHLPAVALPKLELPTFSSPSVAPKAQPLVYDAANAARAQVRLAQTNTGPLIVNSNGDAPDTNPGNLSQGVPSDGVCSTGNTITGGAAECTLRAAVQESNGSTTQRVIQFASNVTGTITLTNGAITLTSNTIINGPTDRTLTVSGNNASGIFNNSTGGLFGQATDTISNLTLTKGNAALGGAINSFSIVTLTNCTLSNNVATQSGGAIYATSSFTLNNCIVSGNKAPQGGAINGGVTINGGILSNNVANATNVANQLGGAILNQGSLKISGATLSGNSAYEGGAIFSSDGFGNSNVTLTNSTLSGNNAGQAGGAVYNGNGTLNITACTLSGNTATIAGGGVFNAPGGGLVSAATVNATNSTFSGNTVNAIANQGALTLDSDTFAGNTAPANPQFPGVDVYQENNPNQDPVGEGSPSLTVRNSIFNDTATGNRSIVSNTGTNPANISDLGNNIAIDDANGALTASTDKLNTNAKVGALANNGGPTQTIALQTGSPAINTGNTTLATDQRGVARPQGSAKDIGAFESGGTVTPPAKVNTTTTLSSSANPSTAGQSVTFTARVAAASGTTQPTGTVTFKDGTTTIGTGTLTGGVATLSTTTLAQGARSITATYGGDTNFNASNSAAVTQTVNASSACSTVVTTNADSGNGSLRAAIDCANSNADSSTITFAAGVTGAINLNTVLPALRTPITITGPGAGALTVQRNTAASTPGFGIFNVLSGVVNNAATGPTVSISGLTISKGAQSPDNGTITSGGIDNAGTLTVTNCILSGNSGSFGGGIQNSGALTVNNCTFSNNSAQSVGGGSGGGIFNFGGTLTATNCVFSNNTTDNAGIGGGIGSQGTLTVTNCTFSANSSAGGGGIINDGGNASISNSTFTGNTSGDEAGAIFNNGLNGRSATLALSNCTLSGNTALFGGGIGNLGQGGSAKLTVSNCTLSGNNGTRSIGGIDNTNASVTIHNTIVNAGTSGANFFNYQGTVTSQGYNLSSDNGGGFLTGTGDKINTDPKLGALADNGGPTPTQGLLAGSPALNMGDPDTTNLPATDQRGAGFPRVVDGRVDIGAFEGVVTAAKVNTTTTVVSSANPSTTGQSVTFTATVAAASGTTKPTGTVTFKDGATTIGTGTLTNGVATFSTTTLAQGARSITATYGGSANFNASNSAALTQTINVATPVKVNTTTTLVSSANPSTAGQSVTFTATVAAASGTTKPTGTVTFKDGATTLGTGTLANGVATFATSSLSAGTHSITANYGGATNFNASTSVALNQVVNAAPVLPMLSISDVTSPEGNSGTKNFVFTVSLAPASTKTVTVNYATANGTATAGMDYLATTGTLTFAPGQTTKTIAVTVMGDTVREANETFAVNLSGQTNANLSDATGAGTIQNDDFATDLSVTQSASPASVPRGSQVTFTIVVKNNGPDAASNVTLTDVLPSGATLISSTPAQTSANGSTLTYSLGNLASGASQTIALRVQTPNAVGTLTNQASVAQSGAVDLTTTNNAANASVAVTNGAPVYTFKIAQLVNVGPYSPSLYHAGAHFVQDVTVTNTGTAPGNAPLQLVLDGLPSNVTLVNAGGVAASGAPFVNLPGSLAVGESVTVRLEFRLKGSSKPTFTPRVGDGTTVDRTANSAPVAQNSSGNRVNAGQTITIPLVGSDANGEALTFKRVSGPVNGVAQIRAQGSGFVLDYTSRVRFDGLETIRFVALDGKGHPSNVATISIQVTDTTPVALNIVDNAIDAQQVSIPVTAINPGGGPLSFKRVGGPTNGVGEFVTANGQTHFVYTSRRGFSGTEKVRYVVFGSEGRPSNVATISIQVTSTTPVVLNFSASANDARQISIPMTATNPGGGTLTFKRVGGPSNGVGEFVTGNDGQTNFVYTSRVRFNGTEVVRYVALNAAGRPSNVATITINVIDATPVALNFTANASDAQPISIPVTATNPGGVELNFKRVGGPTNGVGEFVTGDDGKTNFVYTARRGFEGTETVRYVVFGNEGRPSNIATITINVTASSAESSAIRSGATGGNSGSISGGNS